MNDLIDRKQAISALHLEKFIIETLLASYDVTGFIRERLRMALETTETLIDKISNLPPAQPERKKGKWLVDEDGNMECPFCGNTCGFGNYCNECGADMRGESDE